MRHLGELLEGAEGLLEAVRVFRLGKSYNDRLLLPNVRSSGALEHGFPRCLTFISFIFKQTFLRNLFVVPCITLAVRF